MTKYKYIKMLWAMLLVVLMLTGCGTTTESSVDDNTQSLVSDTANNDTVKQSETSKIEFAFPNKSEQDYYSLLNNNSFKIYPYENGYLLNWGEEFYKNGKVEFGEYETTILKDAFSYYNSEINDISLLLNVSQGCYITEKLSIMTVTGSTNGVFIDDINEQTLSVSLPAGDKVAYTYANGYIFVIIGQRLYQIDTTDYQVKELNVNATTKLLVYKEELYYINPQQDIEKYNINTAQTEIVLEGNFVDFTINGDSVYVLDKDYTLSVFDGDATKKIKSLKNVVTHLSVWKERLFVVQEDEDNNKYYYYDISKDGKILKNFSTKIYDDPHCEAE